MRVLITIAFLTFVTAQFAQSADSKWQTRCALGMYSGDEGTDTDSTTAYGLISLKRYFRLWELAAAVSLLSVKEDGDSKSGLGDTVIKGRYYLVQQKGHLPSVDMMAKVKLPTAESSGEIELGTGRLDTGVGAECLYALKSGFLLLGDAEYTLMGDTSEVDYKNRIMLDAGCGRRFGDIFGSTYLEYRSAVSPGAKDSLSALFLMDYRMTKNIKIDGMIEIGISEGASDFGLATGVRRYF